MDGSRGIVLFGDVVRSRADAPAAAAVLRGLTAELDAVYGDDRLAPFGFTQGDELQGLLRPGADPFEAVVRAALREPAPRLRWVVAAGDVDPGSGPATQRTGGAFLAARALTTEARTRRDDLVVRTGDARADALLDDLAPLLAVLLAELSVRQRAVARLLLVDRLRRSDAAERLNVSRATVTVVAARGRVRSIERLHRALRSIVAEATA